VAAIAAYAASLGCRFTQRRLRKAGWRQVVFGIFVADGFWSAWLLGWFLFQRRAWDEFPVLKSYYILFTLLVTSVVGFIGAFLTVLFYSLRYRDKKNVA